MAYMWLRIVSKGCVSGSISGLAIWLLGTSMFGLGGCTEPCEVSTPGLLEVELPVGVESASNDVLACVDGGFVVTGWTSSSGNALATSPEDIMLVRLDADFNVMWSKTYGGAKGDMGLRVKSVACGGYILLATYDRDVIQENGPQTILFASLMRIDDSGEVLWNRSIEEGLYSEAFDLCTAADGSFVASVLVGYTWSSSEQPGERDMFLMKFDEDGEELWRRTVEEGERTTVYSVANTTDLGYALAGRSDGNVYVAKADTEGNDLWSVVLGEEQGSKDLSDLFRARQIIETSDGGYALICSTDTDHNTDVVKLDRDGVFQWRTRMPGARVTEGYDIAQAPDGTLVAVGADSPNLRLIDAERCSRFYAVRLTEGGKIIWSDKLGGEFSSTAYSVALDASGNAVLAGYKREKGVLDTAYVLLTDAGQGAGR
jgi:outer membrane protein assembly factor BamB